MLDEVGECFTRIAREIARRELLLIVAPQPGEVRKQLENTVNMENVRFLCSPTNDTWARDHGAISVMTRHGVSLYDFTFNGWGLKFAADLDNQITRRAVEAQKLHGIYENRLGFVLEGGSIESNGANILLTTSKCLLSPNRNAQMTKGDIKTYFKEQFGIEQVLWLDYGYLAGDDTDSHIDTLARFCTSETILYVQCTDKDDEHYRELSLMEEQLRSFRTNRGKAFELIPLPLPDAICCEGERLPATYANFLILNDAILYPTYNQPEKDKQAGKILEEAFAGREVIGIDCSPLIKQHGSLHCVTMQYPKTVII